MMRFRSLSPVLAILVAACVGSEAVAPDAPAALSLESARALPPPVQSAQGRLGPGALYEIMVPPAWNGTLVLYAHGFVDADEPLRLPDPTDPTDAEGQLVAALTQLGFATAYSSFSENGWAVKDGAQRTKQLRGIFVSKFGRPARTLVFGGSLGGQIAVKMVEDHPDLYAGALALCGVVGGTKAQMDYLANVRVLFDVFYPGVIPGDLYDLPPEAQRPFYLAAAAGAMAADPLGVAGMQATMTGLGTPIPGVGPEVVQSILAAIAFNFDGFEALLARTHGHPFFDNVNTDYGDPAVNASADRFQATPDALNYLRQYYEPTGKLDVPMVTLHTSDDPAVPVFHESLYGNVVASAGNAPMLDQFIVNRYGHCTFTPSETLAALNVLLAKVGP